GPRRERGTVRPRAAVLGQDREGDDRGLPRRGPLTSTSVELGGGGRPPLHGLTRERPPGDSAETAPRPRMIPNATAGGTPDGRPRPWRARRRPGDPGGRGDPRRGRPHAARPGAGRTLRAVPPTSRPQESLPPAPTGSGIMRGKPQQRPQTGPRSPGIGVL